MNDTWVALNGYSQDEVIGRFSRTMHIWPTAEIAARFVQELREKDCLRGWEQEFYKKSGKVFIAQLSVQVMTVRGEKVILSTMVDITERKRAEQERETTVEFLRLVNESKGTASLIHSAVSFFREHSGFEAVGIRIRDRDDYPISKHVGFLRNS